MKEWALDLHIHSVLSPCGGNDMTPPRILERVRELGFDAVALTDHNTAENTEAFLTKGRELGIKVIPGMELQTREDIHLVCLFDTLSQVLSWQEIVYTYLPSQKNSRESFGEQLIVDKDGNALGEVDRLLLVGTGMSIEQAVKMVHELGGLCIASHIDRQAFSLWGHLGYIPLELELDGVELTPHLPRDPRQMDYIKRAGIHYVISSDAHYVSDLISPRCFANMEECTVAELKMALKEENGRYIRII